MINRAVTSHSGCLMEKADAKSIFVTTNMIRSLVLKNIYKRLLLSDVIRHNFD